MYKLKKKLKRRIWCSPEAWDARQAYKNIEKAKKKHEIKSANRNGHSWILYINVGESNPFIVHAYDFAKEHNGDLPSLVQQFRLMHQRTKSNALDRLGEKVAEAEVAGHDASAVDEDQLFIDVVKEYGYLKKDRPYMIGRRA